MIKGAQINLLKHGDVQLVLHRATQERPKNVNPNEWYRYISGQDKIFRIEKPPMWWKNVWPRILGQVNIMLAKNKLEYIDQAARVWARVGDDIAISIYSWDVDRVKNEYKLGPFHPGCLTDHIRVPIDWWNQNIDEVTAKILEKCKVS